MSKSKINDKFINLLNTDPQLEFDQVEIYHFRNLLNDPNYLSYKDVKVLKEKTPHLTALLDKGFTVVLARDLESPDKATCSISFCSVEDSFEKSQGAFVALKRLYNYCTKKETSSWDYKDDYFFSLSNLPEDREKLIDSVSKYLNTHKQHLPKYGIKVIGSV